MGNEQPPETSEQPADVKRLRLRYAGTCDHCGTPLAQGTYAWYDRRLRTVRCDVCPVDAAAIDIDPGLAGASAQREYERRVASRQSRIKDRFGRRIGGVILALSDEPTSTKAWARGSEGERKLAEALADVDRVRVLHDRSRAGLPADARHVRLRLAALRRVCAATGENNKAIAGAIIPVPRGPDGRRCPDPSRGRGSAAASLNAARLRGHPASEGYPDEPRKTRFRPRRKTHLRARTPEATPAGSPEGTLLVTPHLTGAAGAQTGPLDTVEDALLTLVRLLEKGERARRVRRSHRQEPARRGKERVA